MSLTLLGGFGAVVDRAPVAAGAWRSKKARELVKLLALPPGYRLHREQVLDVLWRDFSPDAALNNLHQAVYMARRALGRDAIAVEDELLRLTADSHVAGFERAASDPQQLRTPAAYRGALSLYRGELLPENRYDDWASARRDELAELAAQLAEELAGLGAAAVGRLAALPLEASCKLVKDAVIDPRRPEALVYSPNGKTLRLAALEYIVFAKAWKKTTPPTLFGRTFDYVPAGNRYGLPPFWALHAWLWKQNPTGTVMAWNPRVHRH